MSIILSYRSRPSAYLGAVLKAAVVRAFGTPEAPLALARPPLALATPIAVVEASLAHAILTNESRVTLAVPSEQAHAALSPTTLHRTVLNAGTIPYLLKANTIESASIQLSPQLCTGTTASTGKGLMVSKHNHHLISRLAFAKPVQAVAMTVALRFSGACHLVAGWPCPPEAALAHAIHAVAIARAVV